MRSLHVVLLMAATNIIGCSGIRTDPSAIMPPPGAMRVCDDGVIDAPGVVSARPNFETYATKVGDFRPRYLTYFDSEPIAVSTDGADWRIEFEGSTSAGDATPPNATLGGTQFAQARRNLYLTTDAGVMKLIEHSAAALDVAGMYAPGQAVIGIASTGSWLPDGSLVAYRAVFRKTDTNDLETRSPPTPWTFRQNDTGASRGVEISIPLPRYALEGDMIEVYRSKAVASGTPSDAMYLSLRYEITGADEAAGVAVIVDELPEDQLGEALYTSTTREGIGGANNPPPRSFALAEWQGSLWAGSARYPQTLAVDLIEAWAVPTTLTVSTTFGNFGASTVDTSGLREGMVIGLPAFPDGTHIVLITSATTFTTDQPANSTSASIAAGEPGDTVTVGGIEYVAASTTNVTTGRFKVWNVPGNPGASAFATARELALVVSYSSLASDDIIAQCVEDVSVAVESRPGRIVFTRTGAGEIDPFTFATTAPDGAFEAVNDGFTSTQETRPNRIAFSKPQEPESFRALDWIEVGEERAHVLALAPLSDALLVFKEDGVWAIFGTFPSFGIERIADAVIVGGDAVDVIDDAAYAHTDRGVLVLDGSGIRANLTEGVIRDELAPYLDGSGPQWVRAWPTLGLVLVAVSEAGSQSAAPSAVYVWNITSRAWCRWTIPAASIAWGGDAGMFAAWAVDRWEIRSSVEARGYDEVHEISAGFWALETGDDAISIATADLGTYAPAVGDIVRATTELPPRPTGRVIGVAVDFDTTILTLDTAFPSGSDSVGLEVYEVAQGVLEWQRNGVTPPSAAGFVREIQVHLDQSDADSDPLSMAALRLTAGATSDQGATRYDLVATPTRLATYSRPVRFGISRQVGRSTHLYPRIEVNELYRWRVLGIALVGNGVSDKVRRT